MLPPGRPFTFLVEPDKLGRIHKVIAHNNGEILDETPEGKDVKVRVQRAVNAPDTADPSASGSNQA